MLALVGVTMPVFWLGALASYYLGFKAGIFPNGGYSEIGEDGLCEWVRHMVLPWIVLATLFIGVYSRVLRSNVLDTINDDYVRTARAKGLSERRVMIHHVLRNSLIPIVTLCGLDFGASSAAARSSPRRSSTCRASASTSRSRSASSTSRRCSP